MIPIDQNFPDHLNFQKYLTQTVQETLANNSVPGVSAAILVDGKPIFGSAVGYRDLEGTALLEPQDQFYIYSVTKCLIMTLILQLAEQKRCALDEPVQTYLPDISLDIPVTLRQLLKHTGGIPDYGAMPAYYEAVKASPAHPWTSAEFLAATLPQGLTFAPGKGWGYSNIGYLLLRMVIENVLQTSLGSALQEHVFAPLELEQIRAAESIADAARLSPGYSSFFASDASLQDIRSSYHPGWVSHGVVISSALELAQVIEAIFAGPLLSKESRAAIFDAVEVPVKHPLFQRPAYGLGMMIDRETRYGIMAGHGGGGPGYSAGALHLPNVHGKRITSVVLANSDRGEVGLPLAFELMMRVGKCLEGD